MPNFIIVGAAKSGTTALYHYLKQHPQVYMCPIKEPEFFAFEGKELNFAGPGDMPRLSITSLQTYKTLFSDVKNEIAIGEASPVYLYSDKAAENMASYLPDVKVIIIIRDPIERAYSQFLMFVRDGREPLRDFLKALQEEEKRIKENWAWGWHYAQVSMYYEQIKRYLDCFGKNQVRVYLYEELNTKLPKVIQEIFEFIEVETKFLPDTSIRHNISGMPRNELVHSLTSKPGFIKNIIKPLLPNTLRKHMLKRMKSKNLYKPELSVEIRRTMMPIVREDILKLQDLLQHDLSHWLKE